MKLKYIVSIFFCVLAWQFLFPDGLALLPWTQLSWRADSIISSPLALGVIMASNGCYCLVISPSLISFVISAHISVSSPFIKLQLRLLNVTSVFPGARNDKIGLHKKESNIKMNLSPIKRTKGKTLLLYQPIPECLSYFASLTFLSSCQSEAWRRGNWMNKQPNHTLLLPSDLWCLPLTESQQPGFKGVC